MLMTQTAQIINQNIGGNKEKLLCCGHNREDEFKIENECILNYGNNFSQDTQQQSLLDGEVNAKGKKEERIEEVEIDKTKYKLYVEESDDANETPYDVIKRLIKNNKERISCLQVNGGIKLC